jgi:hypothetical protein
MYNCGRRLRITLVSLVAVAVMMQSATAAT